VAVDAELLQRGTRWLRGMDETAEGAEERRDEFRELRF
jgi:uncharacterized protein with von Willebrand factor type A (vWA) domain